MANRARRAKRCNQKAHDRFVDAAGRFSTFMMCLIVGALLAVWLFL